MAPNDGVLPEYCTETNSLWVFGYGSLMWKPNFEYSSREIGHIKGYVRRFWQGNTTHRGRPGKPGRVVTLVKQDGGVAWGMAFLLQGQSQILQALGHLYKRECTLGGYTSNNITFYGRNGSEHDVVVFTAMPNCENFMGPATVDTMASQIVHSSGLSGHNLEYLFRLAGTVRQLIPEDQDQHLFDLEATARKMLRCLANRSPSQEMFVTPTEWVAEDREENNNKLSTWTSAMNAQTLTMSH